MRDRLITATELITAGLVPLGAAIQWGAGIGLIVGGVVGFGLVELASFGGRP